MHLQNLLRQMVKEDAYLKKIYYMCMTIDLEVNFTLKTAQYLLHYVT